MKEELIPIKIDRNNHLALWKTTTNSSQIDKNILLTHGTFSNRKVLKGISEYLANNGFTCWVFEWRNHGASSKSKNTKFNFETIAKEDFQYIFKHLFEQEKIKTLDCITHSGGGICLTISLINNPIFQSKINSITFFACQSFGAAESFGNYLKIWTGKQISKILGYTPARKAGREENEDYFLMKQWFNWNLSGKFIGDDKRDYQKEMKAIKVPVLSIFGAGDHIIAPPNGCKEFLSAFQNPSNETLFCSTENGFSENYNHSRVLHSRNASKEIYPSVLNWISKHKTTQQN